MKTNVINAVGEIVGESELAASVFEAPISRSLMQQALVRQLANARRGTHKTKTRGEVKGGGRKPWRQKGTGRARQGTIRAPQWIGGGTVFGPTPRSYAQRMPKRMRRAALRSALSVKATDGAVIVLDQLEWPEAKTRHARRLLSALGLEGQRLLLAYADPNEEALRATRNLGQVCALPYPYLNVRDVLQCNALILTVDALRGVEAWLETENA